MTPERGRCREQVGLDDWGRTTGECFPGSWDKVLPGKFANDQHIARQFMSTEYRPVGDIGTLTAAKDALEIIPVKALFESVIVILGLVRVRATILPLFLQLISRRYGQDELAGDNAMA